MEIFSEVYGCCYRIAARILEDAPLTEKEMRAIASREGFAETALWLLPALLSGGWPFLAKKDGRYENAVGPVPERPLTTLERRWLRSLLADARIRLFLTDDELARLSETLADDEPLWRPEDIHAFDRYSDGDPFGDPDYRAYFQKILTAMKEETFLTLTYLSPRSGLLSGTARPMQLEYSARDDKFRAVFARIEAGVFKNFQTLNLGRILSAEEIKASADIPALDDWLRAQRAELLTIRVSDERNGIERFMTEFSSYEKRSEYDAETETCLVRLRYRKDDETEILIRLLSFGPVLEVLAPDRFRTLMRARILRQYELLSK